MIKPNRAMFYAMLAGFFSVWQKKTMQLLNFAFSAGPIFSHSARLSFRQAI